MVEAHFPMRYSSEKHGLLFVWKAPTDHNIIVTRSERDDWDGIHFHADQNINLYDCATGKVTLDPTEEAFEARVEEWISDMYES